MRGVFDDEELEQRGTRRDTEFTLGSGTLLLLFFGLVLLCGLCFGMGYAVGRRAPVAEQASSPGADGSQTPLQPNAGLAKPSATLQTVVAPPQTSAPVPITSTPAAGAPVATTAVAPISAPSAVQAGQSQIHPALVHPTLVQSALVHPALATSQATMQPAAQTVQPALPQQSQLMVQIAAVQNPEDADVLLNALHKRGYAVTAVRNPIDNLIHVRIGPFSNRQQAGSWQQRLLNDGYNAIIVP